MPMDRSIALMLVVCAVISFGGIAWDANKEVNKENVYVSAFAGILFVIGVAAVWIIW